MQTEHDKDMLQWAKEQASMLRSKDTEGLDFEMLAKYIDAARIAVEDKFKRDLSALLACGIKHKYGHPDADSMNLGMTRVLRVRVKNSLKESPTLLLKMQDAAWIDSIWTSEIFKAAASGEIDLETASMNCIWTTDEILGIEASETTPQGESA